MSRLYTGLLFALCAILPVHAAQSLRGFVIDSTSEEPLPVANVVVEGEERGASTNIDGFFVLPGLEPGTHILHVSYLGYYPKQVEVTVTDEDMDMLTIGLLPTSMALETVTYTVDKQDDEAIRESPRVSTVPVDGTTLRAMPSLGAEMDVLRTIQAIPGVKASSELSSALYVRGASPDMTLILMDQSTVYNPSHLFGLFSTFNADAVKHIELIKGGFPAEYGGRAGSVLDVITNDGNRKKYEGLLMIGLISARAALEGPLPDERGSFAASFRRTYFEPVLEAVRSSNEDFEDIPDYYFYDGNAKVNLDLSRTTTLTIGGYLGHDDFFGEFGDSDARLSVSSYWGNRTGTARLRQVLSNTSFLTVGFVYSYYRSGAELWDLDESNEGENNLLDDFRNRFEDTSLRVDYEYMGLKNHRFKTGIQVNQLGAEVREESEDLVYINIDTTTYNVAYYLQDQWRINSMFEIQPGFRAYYHEGGDYTGLDPRLALVYHHSPEMRFKLAGGRYHQFVNLISAGDLLSFYDIWLPYDGTTDPTVMNQYVLGWEYDFHPEYEFTVETYYNDMERLLEFNQLIDEGDSFNDAFLEGEGQSYGIEFLLRKKSGRWTGWFGYSLAWSERRFPNSYLNEGDWYPPKWDRRNDFIGIAMYRLTDHWDISAQWRYNTGQGYTQGVAGYTEYLNVGLEYDDEYGRSALYGELNNYRYPADHRLDVSAVYNHKFFGLPAKLTLSVYNVYSRRAIWTRVREDGTNPIEFSEVKLLPILPLAGYEVRF